MAAGDEVRLLERPEHDITVGELHRVINVDRRDLTAAHHLLRHREVLPASWADMLHRRLDGHLDD